MAGWGFWQAHKLDVARCEDDLTNSYGMDERGALRSVLQFTSTSEVSTSIILYADRV